MTPHTDTHRRPSGPQDSSQNSQGGLAWLSLSGAIRASRQQPAAGVTRRDKLPSNHAKSNRRRTQLDPLFPSNSPSDPAPGPLGSARQEGPWRAVSHRAQGTHHTRAATAKPQKKENCRQETYDRDPDPGPREDGEQERSGRRRRETVPEERRACFPEKQHDLGC